jgi:hypothetical protein
MKGVEMDNGRCRLLDWIEEREARRAGERAYFARSEAALEVLDRPSKFASRGLRGPDCAAYSAAASIGNDAPVVRINWARHMGLLVRRVV